MDTSENSPKSRASMGELYPIITLTKTTPPQRASPEDGVWLTPEFGSGRVLRSSLTVTPNTGTKRPREEAVEGSEERVRKGLKLYEMSPINAKMGTPKPSQIPNPFAMPEPRLSQAKENIAPRPNSAAQGKGLTKASLQKLASRPPPPRSASALPRVAQRSASLYPSVARSASIAPINRSSSVARSTRSASIASRSSVCSVTSARTAGVASHTRAPVSRLGYQRKPTALEQAQSDVEDLTVENMKLQGTIEDLQRTNRELHIRLSDTSRQQSESVERQETQLRGMRDATMKLKSQNNVMREENTQLRVSQDKLKTEVEHLKEEASQTERLKKQVSTLKEDNHSLRSTNEHLKETLEHTKKELLQRMMELTNQQELSAALRDSVNNLEKNVEQKKEEMAQMDSLLKSGEVLRRKMHNTIQELKGNIRVYCRVRPTTDAEDEARTIEFPNGDDKGIHVKTGNARTATGQEATKSHQFQFDKVFGPTASNGVVFEEISQLVQSALDGYRVCIFAYGQTGSGKTYTMEGPGKSSAGSDVHGEFRGMIPRAVTQIFESSRDLQDQGWEFTLSAQFLEIYNEQIRDLLSDKPERLSGGFGSPKKGAPKIEIKHEKKATQVTNVKVVPVSDATTVCDLLAQASKNRASSATKCNDRSSRSHSVFTLTINGYNTHTQQHTQGILNLIDLAGSERLNASGAVGDRQKETQHINKSLACLGDVIAALAAKQQHVPFRNSKLTYLLQNCLGGDSKTLMFVNVSPDSVHAPESLCSLRFAAKVNSCEIGTAKRNVVLRD